MVLQLCYAESLFRNVSVILGSARGMRGPCGLASAGGLTVTLSRCSACHREMLETFC